MRTVIIHGKKVTERSPRAGRPECELWGVTRANCRFWGSRLLDWTRWTDVHPLTSSLRFPGIPERRPDAWRWMLAQDGTRPIYLQAPEAHPLKDQETALRLFQQVPGAVRFPIREIQQAFPINGEPNRWFVEQTGMMIAHALLEGFERIILNGVGCRTTAEFQIAHRSILYWIAFARGRGVVVELEGPSIFHTPSQIYAYQKFNYDEVERVKHERLERERLADMVSLEEVNDRERRRGRPIRHRIPPEAW
jgi:hypothetical protein